MRSISAGIPLYPVVTGGKPLDNCRAKDTNIERAVVLLQEDGIGREEVADLSPLIPD